MGMYTTLNVNIKLKDNTSDSMKFFINDLMQNHGEGIEEVRSNLSHLFFHDSRMRFLGYGYHSDDSDTSPSYEFPYLNIRCEVKNYDMVLEKFLDWITPCVETIEGTYQYEEDWNPSTVHLGMNGMHPKIYLLVPKHEEHGSWYEHGENDSAAYVEFIPHFN